MSNEPDISFETAAFLDIVSDTSAERPDWKAHARDDLAPVAIEEWRKSHEALGKLIEGLETGGPAATNAAAYLLFKAHCEAAQSVMNVLGAVILDTPLPDDVTNPCDATVCSSADDAPTVH